MKIDISEQPRDGHLGPGDLAVDELGDLWVKTNGFHTSTSHTVCRWQAVGRETWRSVPDDEQGLMALAPGTVITIMI